MAPCLKGPDLQVFTLNLLIYQTVKLLKSVEKPSNLPRLLKFEVDQKNTILANPNMFDALAYLSERFLNNNNNKTKNVRISRRTKNIWKS